MYDKYGVSLSSIRAGKIGAVVDLCPNADRSSDDDDDDAAAARPPSYQPCQMLHASS